MHDIITLIRGIYEKRRSQIIVLGGGHGIPSGENWDMSSGVFKFPDQAIYDSIYRAVELIEQDSDARRITIMQLATARTSKIDDCDSEYDSLFRMHLERYRINAPQNNDALGSGENQQQQQQQESVDK